MRAYFLLLLLVLSLAGCKSEQSLFARVFQSKADSTLQAQSEARRKDPLADLADTRGVVLMLSDVGKLKINGPVTVQAGQGNNATTTGTNNAGRNAESGANGGSSVATTDNKVPVWALLLLAVVAAGVGALGWQKLNIRPG